MSPALGALGLATALVLLSACAAKPAMEAGAPAQPAPAGVTSEEPAAEPGADDDTMAVMTLDDAAASFEQAELQLTELLRLAAAPPTGPDAGDETPGEAETPGRPAPARRLNEHGDGPDRCLSACRALASMQRSATRLCELTGEEDPRCEDVRDRVERARQLVLDACPSCIVAQPADE